MGNIKKESQIYFKLSADDILSIVNDYLEEKISWGTYNSKLTFIIDEDKDIRVVAAYGDINDQSIDAINLEKLDKKIDDSSSKADSKDQSIQNSMNELDKRLYGIETVLHMKDCCVLKQDQNLRKAE